MGKIRELRDLLKNDKTGSMERARLRRSSCLKM